MRSSIKEIVKKIKHFYTHVPYEVLFSIIIILVGLSAFGLGRLSVISENKESVTLKYNNELSDKPTININGSVVVSKSGSKYHYPWCSGANRISEKNKVWYDSIEDAKSAGYTPAGNCKGLE